MAATKSFADGLIEVEKKLEECFTRFIKMEECVTQMHQEFSLWSDKLFKSVEAEEKEKKRKLIQAMPPTTAALPPPPTHGFSAQTSPSTGFATQPVLTGSYTAYAPPTNGIVFLTTSLVNPTAPPSTAYTSFSGLRFDSQGFPIPPWETYGNDFRLRKLKMPLFDGTDVFGWVYRAERFFDVQKVNASGERLRAAPSHEGSLYEQFLNINQEGSAREYVALFEKMAAQLVGIQEEILEGAFIKGLKPELRTAVRTQHPKGVTEAIQLTLLIDETRSGGEWGKSSNSRLGSHTGGEVPRPTASHAGDPNSKLVAGAAGEPPFKRMSEAEFADKKAKGLCFRCDRKFTPGHKCPEKYLQVMVIYDGETN
ncbi:ankyrin repeat-containing protein [Tanacetum coccineum]